MNPPRVHVAQYDGVADWELGHLLVELRTGRFTGVEHEIVAVAETLGPVITMGGQRLVPDMTLADLDPRDSALLVLPGGVPWDAGGGGAFAAAASRFLAAGVPVAAICGATAGLARVGLLDDRDHTSAAPDYLAATGYGGADRYLDARAVVDGDLVTAGPDSPVQFATAVLRRLGLASTPLLEAYEGVFHRADPAAFAALLAATPTPPDDGDDRPG